MDPKGVLQVLDAVKGAGLRASLDGGWGVDALLGRVTRSHEDLDLVIVLEECDRVVEVLAGMGFRMVELDEPGRIVLEHAELGRVDLHAVTVDGFGNAVQVQSAASPVVYPGEGFVSGSILGRAVPCISAEVQVSCRLRYELTEKHRRDVVALCESFRLEVPSEWAEV